MAGEETIGRATIQLGVDGAKLSPEMAAAVARAQAILDGANKKMERSQAQAARAIQRQIDSINAVRPVREMGQLEAAIAKMGGTSKLSSEQLRRVTVQVNALAAAGAKVPASLSGLTGMGSKLTAAFSSLTTGGGISGALAAIGPAGVAAAGALGAVTLAGGFAVRQIADLASKAEEWSNIAKSTGLGIETVQQLSAMLEDAGLPAEALKKGMKALSDEIAGGGKQLAQFGVSIQGWDLMTQEERLRAFATVVKDIQDPAVQSAVAVAGLGKSGADLIPVMGDVASGAFKMYDALGPGGVAALVEADRKIDTFTRKLKDASKRLIAGALELGQSLSFGPAGIPIFTPSANIPAVGGGPGAKQASAAELERQRRAAAVAVESALAKQKKKQEEIAELLQKQYESARKLAFEIMKAAQAKVPGIATTLGIETLPQARSLGPGAMVGAQNFDFGLDAQGFVTWGEAVKDAGQEAKDSSTKTRDFTGGPADLAETMHGFGGVLGTVGAAVVSLVASFSLLKQMGTGANGKFSFGTLGASFKTPEGKMAGMQMGASAIGAAGQALGGSNTVAGSTLGGMAKGVSIGATIGSVIPIFGTVIGGIVGGVIGGAIGFFKGTKQANEAKEAGKILGREVSVAQLKGLKEEAKEAGVDWKTYLKEQKKELDKRAAVEKRQKLEAGLGQAAQFAEQLQQRIAAGGFSEKMKAAAETLIGKVREALLKSGMGWQLDPTLAKSEAFQGAQGAAGDIAGILSGMREAGMVDTGLMGAAAASSQELFDQARAAAIEAGKTPEEAQKAGFGAISQLLREQLNASVQSGKALDENTQRLLDEAKANGIEILADPAIESLNVQKEQLIVLRNIGDALSGGRGKPADANAARGFGPMITPNLGGGFGPRIQTHPGELAMVIPRSRMGPGGLIMAARGIFDDRDRGRGREPRDGPGGGGETGAPGSGGSGGGAADAEALAERVLARAKPATVVNFQNVQNIEANPMQSAESREEMFRMIFDEAAARLDSNSGRLAAAIDRRIRERR